MDRLFSPWRSKYIESFSRAPGEAEASCVLCDASRSTDDDAHFVVTRGALCFVLMNLYPYNSGHLMVVPYRHVPALVDLTGAECAEAMALLQRMTRALERAATPDGFNIGANIGRSAGAGIDQHVHFHIVPRWNGDTNFMPTLADTKLISEDMRATLSRLRTALASL